MITVVYYEGEFYKPYLVQKWAGKFKNKVVPQFVQFSAWTAVVKARFVPVLECREQPFTSSQ